MSESTLYMCLYSANFAFIVTNLYGWILKAFYKAEAYTGNFDNLFPSQGAVAALYLIQIFEIPYLLMIGQPKALFYVNTFSILIFSSLMVVMCDGYFFLKIKKRWRLTLYFLPVAVVVIYLFLAALELVPTNQSTYRVMFWIVSALFAYYIFRLVAIKRHIDLSIRAVNEGRYSNSDDFPVRFARRIEWLPIAICVTMYLCFLLNDPQVKMWRDVLYTVINVWFLLYTLNPHRSGAMQDEDNERKLERILNADNRHSKYKLSAQRCANIDRRLEELIEGEKIFLYPHLTLDDIARKLGINRNYISEVISRGRHGSFYAMINFYRIEHAINMMRSDPCLKMEYIALDSGFSSLSIFSQLFKRSKGVSPSLFAKSLPKGK